MDTATYALTIAVLLVLAVALARFLYVAWRRVMMEAATVQIWRGMERRGLVPADADGEERAMGIAVRRCAMCQSIEECEHWLAGERDDPDKFCPNDMFMQNLERAKRRATAKR